VITAADDAADELTAADFQREWRELDLDNDVWVVENNGSVVTCGGLLKRSGEHIASEGYVEAGHVGRGLGASLLAHELGLG
jgi:hypothetical protein